MVVHKDWTGPNLKFEDNSDPSLSADTCKSNPFLILSSIDCRFDIHLHCVSRQLPIGTALHARQAIVMCATSLGRYFSAMLSILSLPLPRVRFPSNRFCAGWGLLPLAGLIRSIADMLLLSLPS